MSQAPRRQPLTEEMGVLSPASPYGLCDGQSDTGTGFFHTNLVFPCQYHRTVVARLLGLRV
jgi:hypothetical protein